VSSNLSVVTERRLPEQRRLTFATTIGASAFRHRGRPSAAVAVSSAHMAPLLFSNMGLVGLVALLPESAAPT
jgi:hypothetical protein